MEKKRFTYLVVKSIGTCEDNDRVTAILFVLTHGQLTLGEWSDMKGGFELFLRTDEKSTYTRSVATLSISRTNATITLKAPINSFPGSTHVLLELRVTENEYSDLLRAATNLFTRYPGMLKVDETGAQTEK